MFTQIRTFLKPHIFFLDSCECGFKPLWRAASKQCGFGVRILWFRVGEGKKRNECAEWHEAWLAEWHNYAECNIWKMAQRNKLNREACASLPRLFWALIWRSNRLAVLFINAGPNQQGRAARWSSRGLWRKSLLVAVSLTHVYCISFALMQSTNQIIFETKWTPRVKH